MFFKCRACACTVLVCDEIGSIFPEPHDVTRGSGWIHDDTGLCPSCGKAHVRDFARTTMDEAVALGFAFPDLESEISAEVLHE